MRQAELTELEAQRAEKERRKQAFAKALAPEELAAVLVTLREGVSAGEVPVARRALKAFVERVVVRGDELRIDYRAEVLLALGEVPPRGLGRISCDDEGRVRSDIAGTWLALVAAPSAAVWTGRAREICKLRERGETLADIGQRFGLSVERVRQILLQEGQGVSDSAVPEHIGMFFPP